MTRFIIDLTLDGYDTQEEHDAACIAALNEVLDSLGDGVVLKLDTTSVEEDEPTEICQNKMLYVGGSKIAFRCACGANVFSHMKDEDGEYYECHGCHTIYRGEKYDTTG